MKSILKLVASVLLITTIYSCGPSAAEKAAAEKAKQDSIVKATEEATMKKMEEQRATEEKAKQDSMAALEKAAKAASDKASLEQQLSDAKTQLRIANDKMASIKEFKIGRTSSEKDAQIATQYKEIQKWEDVIRKLEEQLR